MYVCIQSGSKCHLVRIDKTGWGAIGSRSKVKGSSVVVPSSQIKTNLTFSANLHQPQICNIQNIHVLKGGWFFPKVVLWPAAKKEDQKMSWIDEEDKYSGEEKFLTRILISFFFFFQSLWLFIGRFLLDSSW